MEDTEAEFKRENCEVPQRLSHQQAENVSGILALWTFVPMRLLASVFCWSKHMNILSGCLWRLEAVGYATKSLQ